MKQFTREQAIAFAESGKWKDMSAKDLALFQMQQDCLCVPFGVFHKAVEDALGRPVFTHEFGLNREGLMNELQGLGPAPSFDEILSLIPAEKLIVVGV